MISYLVCMYNNIMYDIMTYVYDSMTRQTNDNMTWHNVKLVMSKCHNNNIVSKRQKILGKTKWTRGRWAKRFRFCIQSKNGRSRGNTIPQHLQYFFLWTLASYSKIVRGYCPIFPFPYLRILLRVISKSRDRLVEIRSKGLLSTFK